MSVSRSFFSGLDKYVLMIILTFSYDDHVDTIYNISLIDELINVLFFHKNIKKDEETADMLTEINIKYKNILHTYLLSSILRTRGWKFFKNIIDNRYLSPHFLINQCLNEICDSRRVDIIRLIHDNYDIVFEKQDINIVISSGCISILHWFLVLNTTKNNGFVINVNDMFNYIKDPIDNSDIKMLIYLDKHFPYIFEVLYKNNFDDIFSYSICQSDIDIVRWLLGKKILLLRNHPNLDCYKYQLCDFIFTNWDFYTKRNIDPDDFYSGRSLSIEFFNNRMNKVCDKIVTYLKSHPEFMVFFLKI